MLLLRIKDGSEIGARSQLIVSPMERVVTCNQINMFASTFGLYSVCDGRK